MSYDVLICTYNGADYIEEQIKSILVQTVSPHKIIISDDGSSDDTLKIIDRVMNDFSFRNYILINGPQRGVALNFFQAFKSSESEYLFLSDQDDIWIKEKANILLSQAFKCESETPVLLFSDSILINDVGSVLHQSFFSYQKLDSQVLDDDSIFYKNCVQGATVLINKEMVNLTIDSMGYIDTNNIVMHDWWLALLAKYYGKCYFVDRGLILYRQHEYNQVGAKSRCYRYFDYLINFRKNMNIIKKIVLQKNELINFNFSMVNVKSKYHSRYNRELSSKKTYKHVGLFKRFIITIIFVFVR